MTDLITLYTPELLKAFAVLTALLFGANILQAIAAINRRNALTESEYGKRAAMDMLKHATDKAKKVQAERDMANELRDRCEKTMRAAMEENDRLMIEREEMAKDVKSLTDQHDRLLTERATLYFRNAKGQIEPITPQERKPHTLRHGMTVKDPTAYRAKRIFAAARRAGMDWDTSDNMTEDMQPTNEIIFWPYKWDGKQVPCVINRPSSYEPTTYISAREFLRRIKGEIE
jgi:hypothetical protein